MDTNLNPYLTYCSSAGVVRVKIGHVYLWVCLDTNLNPYLTYCSSAGVVRVKNGVQIKGYNYIIDIGQLVTKL